MPFSEALASRLRTALQGIPGIVEKKMFGGLAFMVEGHMCCGVINDELMVRVGPDNYSACLELPGAREMDFTGKPLRGFIYVSEEGFSTASALQAWVERALAFVGTLPPK